MTAAQRELIRAEDPGCLRRVWHGQRRMSRIKVIRLTPAANPPASRAAACPPGASSIARSAMSNPRCCAARAGWQPGHLIGERLLGAAGTDAGEPAGPQLDQRFPGHERSVGQSAFIPGVRPAGDRHMVASRAAAQGGQYRVSGMAASSQGGSADPHCSQWPKLPAASRPNASSVSASFRRAVTVRMSSCRGPCWLSSRSRRWNRDAGAVVGGDSSATSRSRGWRRSSSASAGCQA